MARFTRRDLLKATAATGATAIFGIPEHVLAQAARGGVVVIGTTQRARHLNSAVQSGSATMTPAAQLFATPVRMDANWKPQPFLAERWEVSEDSRSITLYLRKDAKFHDGRPVTAEDVQFSIETVRDNHPFKTMFGPVNAVTISDPHTAVVRLSHPHPALVLAMSTSFLPIIPKHIFGDGQDVKTHPRNANPVGSGPFKLVEFKPGEHIILERFGDFFLKGRPTLDRLIFQNYKDPASMLLALERGEIDIHEGLTDPRSIERAKKAPGVVVQPNGAPAIGPIIWVAFNTKHPQLSDKRVRQAINYAIDKQFIVKTLLGGVFKRATGPIATASPFYDPGVETYPLNLKKATELLDAAGLKAKAGGTRFAISVDAIPGVSDMKVIQEYLKPALAKVGIEVNVRASPDFPTWARRVSTFQFDVTLDSVWNWGDPVIGVHRTWLSSNIREGVIWSNTQQYSNPKVDEILAQAGMEMDAGKRKALYSEFQKIVVDDCPVAFIHEPSFHYGYRTTVQNRPTSVWGLVSPLDEMGIRKA